MNITAEQVVAAWALNIDLYMQLIAAQEKIKKLEEKEGKD